MSESEQREIENWADKWYYAIPNRTVQQKEGYIAGATAMAEKKNLETKVWKNTADEFKKYNDDLKAQLEAAQEELATAQNEREGWNKISVDYAVALEKAEKIIAAKEAELSQVKEELEITKEELGNALS